VQWQNEIIPFHSDPALMLSAAISVADLESNVANNSTGLPLTVSRRIRAHPSISKKGKVTRFSAQDSSIAGVQEPSTAGYEQIGLVDVKMSADLTKVALYFCGADPKHKYVAHINRQALNVALRMFDTPSEAADESTRQHVSTLSSFTVPLPPRIMSLRYVKGVATRDVMEEQVFRFFNPEISSPVILPERGMLPPDGLPSEADTLALDILNAMLLFQVFDVEWYFCTQPRMPFRARLSSAFYRGKTLCFLVYVSSGKFGPGVYDRPMLLREAYYQTGHAQGLNLLQERTADVVAAGTLHPSAFHSKADRFVKAIHVVTGYRPTTTLVDTPLHESEESLTLFDLFKWVLTLQFRTDKVRRVKEILYKVQFFRELSCGGLHTLVNESRKGRDGRMLAVESSKILSKLPASGSDRSARVECARHASSPQLCCAQVALDPPLTNVRARHIASAEASAKILLDIMHNETKEEHRKKCRDRYQLNNNGQSGDIGRSRSRVDAVHGQHRRETETTAHGACVCRIASFMPLNMCTASDILSICHSSLDPIFANLAALQPDTASQLETASQLGRIAAMNAIVCQLPTLQFPLLAEPAMRHKDGTLRQFRSETLKALFDNPSQAASFNLDDLPIVQEQSSDDRKSIAGAISKSVAVSKSVKSAHHRQASMLNTNRRRNSDKENTLPPEGVVLKKRKTENRGPLAPKNMTKAKKLTNMKQNSDVEGLLTNFQPSTQDAKTSELLRRIAAPTRLGSAEANTRASDAEVRSDSPLLFDPCIDEEFHWPASGRGVWDFDLFPELELSGSIRLESDLTPFFAQLEESEEYQSF